MRSKAQGALEYMLLIGGAVLIAAIVLVIIIGASGSAACKPGKDVLKTRLIQTATAYWDFDEGSGGTAKDKTVNGNNGTLKGNPGWSSDCISGSCLAFDETTGDYVKVPYLSVFNQHSFSVELWARFDDEANETGLLESNDTSEADRYLHIVRRGVKPYFGFYADDLAGNTSLLLGKWWHLVFTWDSSTRVRKIFVNGSLDSSDVSTGLLTITSGAGSDNGVWIGRVGTYFNGTMDEVRIYNSALSADTIKEHYEKEKC